MLMEARNPSPSPSPVRVLIRPPPSSTTSTTATAPSSSAPPPPPPSTDNVVVIGFISQQHDDSTHLLNRVIDSNVFASGNLDKPLLVEDEEAKEWFKRRRISYFRDRDKGILFLHFASTLSSFVRDLPSSGFDSVVEECEFGDLQGMLFMFSVS